MLAASTRNSRGMAEMRESELAVVKRDVTAVEFLINPTEEIEFLFKISDFSLREVSCGASSLKAGEHEITDLVEEENTTHALPCLSISEEDVRLNHGFEKLQFLNEQLLTIILSLESIRHTEHQRLHTR